jgi:hypothetical protein
VIAASRAEATITRDRYSKDLEALAALGAKTASTTGPAVTAATVAHEAVLRCKQTLDSAQKTELRRKTTANVPAFKRAEKSFDKATELLQKAVESVRKIFLLCHTLQVSSEQATKSVKAVSGDWQVELDTIVTKPSSKAGVDELRHHVTTVLCLPVTREGISTKDCLKPALEDAVDYWYAVIDVHADNLDRVEAPSIAAQLRAHFQDEASKWVWIETHIQWADPADYQQDGEPEARQLTDRALLRHVLARAHHLEFTMQPRTFTSQAFEEEDGRPRVYSFLKEVELFVMCVMHAEMRVGGNIVNMLLTDLKMRKDITEIVKLARWEALEDAINLMLHPAMAAPAPRAAAPAAVPQPSAPIAVAEAPLPAVPQPPICLHPHARRLTEEDMEVEEQSEEQYSQYVQQNHSDQQDQLPEGMRAVARTKNTFRLPDMSSEQINFQADCKYQLTHLEL